MLSALAISIYHQYYTHLWDDEGRWYTQRTYNAQKIREELSDLNNFHYAAFAGGQPVGYLKLRLGQSWKGLEDKRCLEIERIYILRESARSGLGKKLMSIAEEVAEYHDQQVLFLKAMDSSQAALAFYQKQGFEICDTLTLSFTQMKREYRGMVVLQKTVRPADPNHSGPVS